MMINFGNMSLTKMFAWGQLGRPELAWPGLAWTRLDEEFESTSGAPERNRIAAQGCR